MTTFKFIKTNEETLTHFKGRVQRSITNMRKHNCKVTRLTSTANEVVIQAPLHAASYITPKIID